MHHSSTLSVGLDVHKESIAVAYVAKDHNAEVIYLRPLGTQPCDIAQLVRTLQAKAKHLVFVYHDLGLTPSEYSSGERRRQGGITKTGNIHARRARGAGAWADRDPAHVSRHLQRRLEKLPKPLQDISWKAQARLCTRYRQLSARGKHPKQVVVAMARELIALMWAIAKQVPVSA